MSALLIGSRFKALREERNLSQHDLAQILGFKDRQTVSAIETGARRVRADELVLAMERLDATLEYFTDPFRLVGEGQFSWRHTGVGAEQLREYERVAGSWIAAFRALAPRVGRELPLMRRSLGLTPTFAFRRGDASGRAVRSGIRSRQGAGGGFGRGSWSGNWASWC